MSCLVFGARMIRPEDVAGRRVLEVGALNVNGSLRPLIESWKPREYIGVDITEGPGVDRICDAEQLVATFGEGAFDLVLCTEVLEHVRDWRSVVHNLKHVVVAGGGLLVTTRSHGFPFHAWPNDFWRYEVGDFQRMFADCASPVVESDPEAPGVFAWVRRPPTLVEGDLASLALFSMITGGRTVALAERDFGSGFYRRAVRRERLRQWLSGLKTGIKRILPLGS